MGLILTLCNGVVVIKSIKEMNSRGKVYTCAFFVCAAAALGDHLAFTAGVDRDYLTPMIVSKIFGGVLSLILCALLLKDTSALDAESKAILRKQ